MSIQFYPAREDGRPLLRCACDVLDEYGLGEHGACSRCAAMLDTNERNGRDLLDYLGIADGPLDMGGPSAHGKIAARELVKLCRARLAMVEAESEIPAADVGRVFTGGRSADYMRKRTIALLAIATLAGDLFVAWS